MKIRKAKDRGVTDLGWLLDVHTFSFGDFVDTSYHSFGDLRVLNEGTFKPNSGFDMHPHRDMEIITYIISGSIRHRDSIGNNFVTNIGEIQHICAGSGIMHVGENPSKTKPAKILQIWIKPEENNLKPYYEQKSFAKKREFGKLVLLAAGEVRENCLKIHQDAELFLLELEAGMHFKMELLNKRMYWIQIVNGSITLNNESLNEGDGAGIDDSLKQGATLNFAAVEKSEILIFNLKA